MKSRWIKVLSLVMLGLIPCTQGINPLIKSVYAQSRTNTTIYLPGVEKNLTTGETNKYYSVGGATLQRNTKGGVEKLYYLFPDHLSSTKLIINKDKTEINYLSYYPYGNLSFARSHLAKLTYPVEVTNLYTGQKQDQEINLYYYNARYYNPTIGHFISADSAEGPNRYAYVGNNPVMKNDPSGLAFDSGGGGGGNSYSLPMILKGRYQPDVFMSPWSGKDTLDDIMFRSGSGYYDPSTEYRNFLNDNPDFNWNDPNNGDLSITRLAFMSSFMEQNDTNGTSLGEVAGYLSMGFAGAVMSGGLDSVNGLGTRNKIFYRLYSGTEENRNFASSLYGRPDADWDYYYHGASLDRIGTIKKYGVVALGDRPTVCNYCGKTVESYSSRTGAIAVFRAPRNTIETYQGWDGDVPGKTVSFGYPKQIYTGPRTGLNLPRDLMSAQQLRVLSPNYLIGFYIWSP